MAAAASSDIVPAAPTTLLAALSSQAAAASGLLASTEYGCPEVSTHPSALLIFPGASNCISGPRSTQPWIVPPLTAATTTIVLIGVHCCLVIFLTILTMRRVKGANHTPVRLPHLGIPVFSNLQYTWVYSDRYHRHRR